MKCLFLIALLTAALTANAQVSLGLTIQNSLDSYTYSSDPATPSTNTTSFDMLAGPAFRIMMSRNFELAPSGGFQYQYQSNANGQTTTSITQVGTYLGCGLYFYLLSQGFVRFSLGPDVNANFWFSHDEEIVGVGLPLNLDFQLNPSWSIRASARAFEISYHGEKTGTQTSGWFDYNLQTVLSPSFTLYYTF